MNHIKLIAKPDTWFKAGTEVFNYDSVWPDNKIRITVEEWNEALKHGAGILVTGIRICENPQSESCQNKGEEYIDGEWCALDEFQIEEI